MRTILLPTWLFNEQELRFLKQRILFGTEGEKIQPCEVDAIASIQSELDYRASELYQSISHQATILSKEADL